MHEQLFWKLDDILAQKMDEPTTTCKIKRKRGKNPNGYITTTAQLSMAIRYFSGGCPLDIDILCGVDPLEVLGSVWKVVDAVNFTPSLWI